MITSMFPRYRRNLLTFGQNSSLLNHWTLFTLLMSCFIALPMLGLAKDLFTPVAMFWIHNLFYFGFIDLFHGVILPLTVISIPAKPKETSSEKKSFFVRTTLVLEPRRSRASAPVPSKSEPTVLERNSENKKEKTWTAKKALEDNKKLLQAARRRCHGLQHLSSEAGMVESPQCSKISAARKLNSYKPWSPPYLHHPHSSSSHHNHLLDPMDLQCMAKTMYGGL